MVILQNLHSLVQHNRHTDYARTASLLWRLLEMPFLSVIQQHQSNESCSTQNGNK